MPGQLAQRNSQRTQSQNSIAGRAVSALRQTGDSRILGVGVQADETGRITLTGRVSSYYAKQLAQAVVQRLDGVVQLKNDVVVH